MIEKFDLKKVGLGKGDVLCNVADIPDGEAKEFSYRSDSEVNEIFIQRLGNDIFAYVNVCPHAGTPLNMETGQFMERGGRYIMCHTHGALFELGSGLCVAGPCNGDKLQAVDVKVENGEIIVL